jgi:hypothetical protein
MTEDAQKPAEKLQVGVPFKKGYDPRRWLKGRNKKPANQKRAEEILLSLIWDVLSEEITNPMTGEQVDRFRAMIRSMTTSRQASDKQAILDRIAGKVTQDIDVTSGGEPLKPPQIIEVVKSYEREDEKE